MESVPHRTPETETVARTRSSSSSSQSSGQTPDLSDSASASTLFGLHSLHQFFEDAPPLASDAFRVERLLATARFFLALGTLVTFGHAGSSTGQTATALIIGFTTYSAIVWSALRKQSALTGRLPVSLHVLDLTWVMAMTSVTGGIASPLFGLFLFVLLEAAYRWGFQATLITIASLLCLSLPQAAILNAITARAAAAGQADPLVQRFAISREMLLTRTAYLVMAGLLVGYVAGREKQHRDESAAIARLTGAVRVGIGMMGSLKALFPELLQLSGARAIVLVSQEPRDGRLCLWQLDDSSDLKVSSCELVPSHRDAYLFPMSGDAWYVTSAAAGLRPTVEVISLQEDGRVVKNMASPLPDTFAERHPFHSLIGISMSGGDEWQDRLFLIDPVSDARQLPFFLRLARELGPALQSVYVQGRMNSRVGERERARVARELHDTTIQSLIGLEMELAAWRSRVGDAPSPLDDRLCVIQQRLRDEVVNLRELLQQLRPVNVEPSNLVSYLSELVCRFRRETGVAASFASDVEVVDISHEVCSGLIRILQEALVNIRKHSGAHTVDVRFSRRDNRWALIVDDDGFGFDFVGRRPHAELDAILKGPSVIKERVRLLGGELTLDSDPTRGARLEVTLPGAVHV